jgi:hypothetical protein
MTPDTPRLKVIVIVGCSRSGSTLLGSLLDQPTGFLHVGELHHLWKRCFGQDWPCECGRAFSECDLWRDVSTRALGQTGPPDVKRMRELRREAHTGNITARREYAAVLGHFLHAAADQAGARVIVDTSKNAYHAQCLLACEGLDVRPVHMARHPLGVIHSMGRRRDMPGPRGVKLPMQRMGPLQAMLHWRREIMRAERLVTSNNGVTLRYDELTTDPAGAMSGLLADLDEPDVPLDFLDGHTAALRPGHSLSGNPMRHHDGAIEIRRDDKWEHSVSPWVRRLVLLGTGRLRRRLGWV